MFSMLWQHKKLLRRERKCKIGFGWLGMRPGALLPAVCRDLTSTLLPNVKQKICLLLTCATLTALSGVGCHKHGAAAIEKPKTLQDGMVALQASLATASAAAQSNFYGGVSMGIRYNDYNKASLYLQQIASDPSLNDAQKKLVGDVGDLVKQAMDGQKK